MELRLRPLWQMSMIVRELVVLVKYAQELVNYSSFLDYVRILQPNKRDIFLREVIELIIKMQPQHYSLDDVIKMSNLDKESKSFVMLRVGIEKETLLQLATAPDEDLKETFKVLLSLFSLCYKPKFNQNRNATDKFWYWDFSEISNTLKLLSLKTEDVINLDFILNDS